MDGEHRGAGPSLEAPPPERTWSAGEERALRLWIALARCYATFARAVAARVAEYGLTTPQFGVLEALHHLCPLPLGELAEKLLVTGGNVTYVMDRLEEQGLVMRERSSADRRVVRAQLTEAGERLVAEVFPGHAEAVAELAADAPERVDADWLPAGPFTLGLTAGASTPNNKIGEALLRVLRIRGVDAGIPEATAV